MFRPLVQRLRRAGLRRQVRKAMDAGIGVYNRTWPLDQATASPSRELRHFNAEVRSLADQVLDWCRFTMGNMRKPYGLDYVSLVIAVFSAEDRELAEANLGVMRPREFYGEGGVARQVEEVLIRWEEENLLSSMGGSGPPRLVALLFSWGDLTRELKLAG